MPTPATTAAAVARPTRFVKLVGPSAATMPNLKRKFERSATRMTRQAMSGSILSELASWPVESVIASRSVRPETTATT